jgi:hypothetical protein
MFFGLQRLPAAERADDDDDESVHKRSKHDTCDTSSKSDNKGDDDKTKTIDAVLLRLRCVWWACVRAYVCVGRACDVRFMCAPFGVPCSVLLSLFCEVRFCGCAVWVCHVVQLCLLQRDTDSGYVDVMDEDWYVQQHLKTAYQCKQDKKHKQGKKDKQGKQDKQGKKNKQDKQGKKNKQDKQDKKDKQDKQDKKDKQVKQDEQDSQDGSRRVLVPFYAPAEPLKTAASFRQFFRTITSQGHFRYAEAPRDHTCMPSEKIRVWLKYCRTQQDDESRRANYNLALHFLPPCEVLKCFEPSEHFLPDIVLLDVIVDCLCRRPRELVKAYTFTGAFVCVVFESVVRKAYFFEGRIVCLCLFVFICVYLCGLVHIMFVCCRATQDLQCIIQMDDCKCSSCRSGRRVFSPAVCWKTLLEHHARTERNQAHDPCFFKH